MTAFYMTSCYRALSTSHGFVFGLMHCREGQSALLCLYYISTCIESLYSPTIDRCSCVCAGLTGMLDINLLGCRRVSELQPLRGLSRLTALSLRNCDGLGDAALAPISGLLSLASLDLSGCTHLTGAG